MILHNNLSRHLAHTHKPRKHKRPLKKRHDSQKALNLKFDNLVAFPTPSRRHLYSRNEAFIQQSLQRLQFGFFLFLDLKSLFLKPFSLFLFLLSKLFGRFLFFFGDLLFSEGGRPIDHIDQLSFRLHLLG